jgi:hypothetical protein
MLAREWRGDDSPRLVDTDHGRLSELLAVATGERHVPCRIHRANSFLFSAQLADRFKEGRVFLVGDAAHRMTPRGGTGMNTAIQDAFDIGWKLAWVLNDWAGAPLLDSYEVERRPVARHNVQRSARPDGARQDAKDALPWDLCGRLPHHWVDADAENVSTLDLLGDGFTLLAGPAEPRWLDPSNTHRWTAPLTAHRLDRETADTLGITPTGAVLIRPDGKSASRWTSFPNPLTPQDPLPSMFAA